MSCPRLVRLSMSFMAHMVQIWSMSDKTFKFYYANVTGWDTEVVSPFKFALALDGY